MECRIWSRLPGMKVSTEAGDSTANIPNESLSIQTRGRYGISLRILVWEVSMNLSFGKLSIIA